VSALLAAARAPVTAAAADATSPARREAHEPPEARGLARDAVRMLVATADDLIHARARDLPDFLRPGDIVVVNTSATLPAALTARRSDGTPLRLHLSTRAGGERRWVVELRAGAERFCGGRAGERLALPGGARATLVAPYLPGARLWLAELDTGWTPLLDYLNRHGAPIRYGYMTRAWPLADYQTVFAAHPGSAEMPSAGRPFTQALVSALGARGVAIARVTLHTGVSSQEAGEPPYPERFAVPRSSARAINAARGRGGRVIAIGTTVVRALETVARPDGTVARGAGWTRHLVTPEAGVRSVDGLLTGWHEPEATHLLMLEAVAGCALVEDSYRAALERGYLWHEFGDVHLLLP
jgi:S-adenosylmethionine:tRNA ribosyltransferase-isomerase